MFKYYIICMLHVSFIYLFVFAFATTNIMRFIDLCLSYSILKHNSVFYIGRYTYKTISLGVKSIEYINSLKIKLHLNSMINHCIWNSILSENDILAYILWYIYNAIKLNQSHCKSYGKYNWFLSKKFLFKRQCMFNKLRKKYQEPMKYF